MADASAVVGRLAPSPTGRLHLGHARSFLIAWWSARARDGRVVLRIEDLDGERVKPGATELVLEDLAWLGLDWDGDPLLQTTRASAHREALESLVQQGRAYPCVCTRREISDAASAPHGDTGEQPYPGTCRGRFASVEDARASTGRDPAIRLTVDAARGPMAFGDAIQGPCSVDVAGTAGDFVIARKDGQAAYQLATPSTMPTRASPRWSAVRTSFPAPGARRSSSTRSVSSPRVRPTWASSTTPRGCGWPSEPGPSPSRS